MKKIKIYFAIFTLAILSTACLVDDTVESDAYAGTPNIAGFVAKTQNLSAVTDGSEYTFAIALEVKGPTSADLSGDITVTIEVDPASTAIENTHFKFPTKTMTLTQSSGYSGSLPVILITNGIMAPLAETPILLLNVSSVDSSGNVIANGKKLTVSLVYQCYADLSGTYMVTNDFCNPSFTTTITANTDGSWHLDSADGGFLHQCTSNTTLLNPGNITELCGDILPSGDLDYGSANFVGAIGDITGGSWDAVNGVLILEQGESYFTSGPYTWTSTYTRI